MLLGPDLPRDRLRARGRARGDRDVRGRAVRTASTTCSTRRSSAPIRSGRRMLGRAEVISSIPVPEIDAYHKARATRPTTSSSRPPATSSTSRSSSSPSSQSRHRDGEGRRAARRRRPRDEAGFAFHGKETEQYHVSLGGPGIDRERRAALRARRSSTPSSAARPPRASFARSARSEGLAYAVGSYTQQYVDSGLVGLYVGTREDKVDEACEVIGARAAQAACRGDHATRS